MCLSAVSYLFQLTSRLEEEELEATLEASSDTLPDSENSIGKCEKLYNHNVLIFRQFKARIIIVLFHTCF